MSWLFFMDESGHDHGQVPYEIRGGFALEDSRLWPFIRNVMELELECFGARLADYKSEIKGTKLLSADRFKQAGQMDALPELERQEQSRAFLQAGLEKRPPTKKQFTAYGQASLTMADGLFDLLKKHKAIVFASSVPRGAAKPPPEAAFNERLRKDHIFLLERFFYFLEKQKSMGMLVMDEVEKKEDTRFVRRMHAYFTKTDNGRARARWIVPAPFFVSSEMALPVQVADVVIYCINWAYRHGSMDAAETREEIRERYDAKIHNLVWHGDGYSKGKTFQSFGIVCVPDLFVSRK